MSASPHRLQSAAGLSVELLENGALRRMDHGDTILNLFLGNELEGGVANLYLRRSEADATQCLELLGPRSPTKFQRVGEAWVGAGAWSGIRYTVTLKLAGSVPAWFWHVTTVPTVA